MRVVYAECMNQLQYNIMFSHAIQSDVFPCPLNIHSDLAVCVVDRYTNFMWSLEYQIRWSFGVRKNLNDPLL